MELEYQPRPPIPGDSGTKTARDLQPQGLGTRALSSRANKETVDTMHRREFVVHGATQRPVYETSLDSGPYGPAVWRAPPHRTADVHDGWREQSMRADVHPGVRWVTARHDVCGEFEMQDVL